MPILEAELSSLRSPSTRLMAMYGHESFEVESFRSRIPLVIIIYHKDWAPAAENYASRFVDYSKDEWESHEIEDWVFLRAKDANQNKS